MNDIEIKAVGANLISIEQIADQHRCRFVFDGEQIKLDQVKWASDRAPVNAEDILEDMWAVASRYRSAEHRA